MCTTQDSSSNKGSAARNKRNNQRTKMLWYYYWIIIAGLEFHSYWHRAAAAATTSSNFWDLHKKISRVVRPKTSIVVPYTTSLSSSPLQASVADHTNTNHHQTNWFHHALSHRFWKPSQFFERRLMRRGRAPNKSTTTPTGPVELQQQQQQKHTEVAQIPSESSSNIIRHQVSSHNTTSGPPLPTTLLQPPQSHSTCWQDTETPSAEFSSTSVSPPWISTILAAVSPWLHGRRLITGIQVGLIALLLRQVWKAAQEVIEEYTSELNGDPTMSSSSFAGGGALKPDIVERVVQVVELIQQAESDTQTRGMGGRQRFDRSYTQVPNILNAMPSTLLPWIQLAQNLIAAGLPLRRSRVDHHISSVEHVLRTATRTELALLQQCLWTPSTRRPHKGRHESLPSMSSSFSHIAGLDSVKQSFLDLLLLLQQQQIHQESNTDDSHLASVLDGYSHLLFPSQSHADSSTSMTSGSKSSSSGPIRAGILLYGPPGCGKTLLVKSLASVAQMPCLVVSPSTLLRKFVGDSNQQVRSLFTLASKLGNCIICIDELDGLFRQRHDQEHDVTRDLKTEFLQWWDGMMVAMHDNSNDNRNPDVKPRRPLLVVVGATNRPFDVDPAVLRRLPQSYYIGMPTTSDRLELLHQLIYRNRKRTVSPRRPIGLAGTQNEHEALDLVQLAVATRGYTPSDLQQLLQTAVTMGPLRRMQDAAASKRNRSDNLHNVVSRQLLTQDVLNAMTHVRPSPLSASYQRALENFVHGNNPSSASETKSERELPTTVSSRWETTWGNFYHIGTLEMDMGSWNVLQRILLEFDISSVDGRGDGRSSQGQPFYFQDTHPPQQDGREDISNNYDDDDDDDDDDDESDDY